VLLGEGIVRLLTEARFELVAQAATADGLVREAAAHRPSLMIADITMPPGGGDDGLQAALEVRRRQPDIGVLILSHYYDEGSAHELLAEGADSRIPLQGARRRRRDQLSPRELEVLAAMAEGSHIGALPRRWWSARLP